MSVPELTALARKHWAQWLPEKTRELEAQGIFSAETQKAAVQAQAEISELMQSGYQEHEAREVVLPQYILLPPEDDAAVDEAEREELAELEADYQSWAKPLYDPENEQA